MITHETIQTILEAARVEEVVGEFVNLKKRGVNYIGLCPFHNEKTPSFTVSPSKGFFKCFGCGKGGSAVSFLMEHEHYSYPEALKYLAKKYGITIEEKEQTPEQIQALNEQEALYSVSAFAQKHFTDNLFQTEEGKAIGLTYFKEREFKEEIITKFQLGYSIDTWDDLTVNAQENGYKLDYLIKTGLTGSKDDKHYDRFRGRVMFPIHNLSGRIIGFGGRILSGDGSRPKYVNSPESDIYHKSSVLYGIYFAKNAVISKDNCYLVEGYTDVISLHQAGIENVVASSGTSLTTEQIKLIKRFSKNITILYDGDEAGIKASFRGIDMILEEGLNVKIVLFPQGEDPDSYARSKRPAELTEFITKSASDFITFKTNILLKETDNDPIKKASLIKEIVNTIALIPDAISRMVYIKECSAILSIAERTLMNELNKIIRKKFTKDNILSEEEIPEATEYTAEKQILIDEDDAEIQERNIIRLLLNYGTKEIIFKELNEDKKEVDVPVKVGEFIVTDINSDEIKFDNNAYQLIFDEYASAIEKGSVPEYTYFINHPNETISKLIIDFISEPYTLSENWEKKHKIYTLSEDKILGQVVTSSVFSLKNKKVEQMIAENQKELKNASEEDTIILIERQKKLKNLHKEISAKLGRIITK